MVPLFIKESDPNSVSSADISFAFIYLPWKENTILPFLYLLTFTLFNLRSDRHRKQTPSQFGIFSVLVE